MDFWAPFWAGAIFGFIAGAVCLIGFATWLTMDLMRRAFGPK